MPADPHPPGVPAPRSERQLTTAEAAVLLGIDEGALWRPLDDTGQIPHNRQATISRDNTAIALEHNSSGKTPSKILDRLKTISLYSPRWAAE